MAYTKRFDGRAPNQARPIEAKVSVIPNAKGSASFKIGNTTAIAAVYGPRELHPRFLQNPKKAVLRCTYTMMPFSGQGNRVRPGPNRRAKEIAYVIENALAPAIDLTDFPNAVVDVFVELPQTDAGSRCACICAASLALADAGFKMRDLPASIAVGKVGGMMLVDPNYDEEAYKEEGITDNLSTDLPLCILPRTGEVSLMQLDGPISPEELEEAVELGKAAAKDIQQIMADALRAKYN